MAMTRRDWIGAVVLGGFLAALVTVLYFTIRRSGRAVGYEENFFVQQRVRINNQNQKK